MQQEGGMNSPINLTEEDIRASEKETQGCDSAVGCYQDKTENLLFLFNSGHLLLWFQRNSGKGK